MNKKKTYVSPQVTRVKLEPTQAVLSQCSVGVGNAKAGVGPLGFCQGTAHPNCKSDTVGQSAATS
jgi:hypothetical protein